MAKLELAKPLESFHGKLSQKSEDMVVQNAQTKQHFSRKVPKRDYNAHPVTENERQGQDRMKEAVAAYRQLKNDPVAYGAFMEQYNQAMESAPYRSRAYNFFISRFLDQGKDSHAIKVARSSTTLTSYVEAVRQCPDHDAADRVILDFLRTMGFTDLADAYSRHLSK